MENQHHSEPSHSYGCAFKQRGAECDCQLVEEVDPFLATLGQWLQARRASLRGIDYTRYTVTEGIDEGDDE